METQREEELRKKIDPLAYIFREKILEELQRDTSNAIPIPKTIQSYAVVVKSPKKEDLAEEPKIEYKEIRCPICNQDMTDSSQEDFRIHIEQHFDDTDPTLQGEWIICETDQKAHQLEEEFKHLSSEKERDKKIDETVQNILEFELKKRKLEMMKGMIEAQE